MLDKKQLIAAVLEKLQEELSVYFRAANASRAEATHEQSKAESKYDTRGLEASYLARGQSKQAAELVDAIESIKTLPIRDFAKADLIDLGALVVLEQEGEREFYWLGPMAGGTEVQWEDREVLVITPSSPLGASLMGRKGGEQVTWSNGATQQSYRVVEVR